MDNFAPVLRSSTPRTNRWLVNGIGLLVLLAIVHFAYWSFVTNRMESVLEAQRVRAQNELNDAMTKYKDDIPMRGEYSFSLVKSGYPFKTEIKVRDARVTMKAGPSKGMPLEITLMDARITKDVPIEFNPFTRRMLIDVKDLGYEVDYQLSATDNVQLHGTIGAMTSEFTLTPDKDPVQYVAQNIGGIFDTGTDLSSMTFAIGDVIISGHGEPLTSGGTRLRSEALIDNLTLGFKAQTDHANSLNIRIGMIGQKSVIDKDAQGNLLWNSSKGRFLMRDMAVESAVTQDGQTHKSAVTSDIVALETGDYSGRLNIDRGVYSVNDQPHIVVPKVDCTATLTNPIVMSGPDIEAQFKTMNSDDIILWFGKGIADNGTRLKIGPCSVYSSALMTNVDVEAGIGKDGYLDLRGGVAASGPLVAAYAPTLAAMTNGAVSDSVPIGTWTHVTVATTPSHTLELNGQTMAQLVSAAQFVEMLKARREASPSVPTGLQP